MKKQQKDLLKYLGLSPRRFKLIRHITEGQQYDDRCFIGWKVYPKNKDITGEVNKDRWKIAFNFYLFTIAFKNWKYHSGYVQFWSRFIKNSSIVEIK